MYSPTSDTLQFIYSKQKNISDTSTSTKCFKPASVSETGPNRYHLRHCYLKSVLLRHYKGTFNLTLSEMKFRLPKYDVKATVGREESLLQSSPQRPNCSRRRPSIPAAVLFD